MNVIDFPLPRIEPVEHGEPDSFGRGRVCMADHCDTIMHQYHEGVFCYVHEHLAEEDERPVLRLVEAA